MSSTRFIQSLQHFFAFLSSIMDRFMEVFEVHPWLFSLIVAPVITVLIMFGVSISFDLISNQFDSGKGER